MNNPFKRTSDTAMVGPPKYVPGPLSPPPSRACAGCGGLFLLTHLTDVPTVVVYTDRKGDIATVTVRRREGYCSACKPEADIIFAVQADEDNDPEDTRHFRVSDLYFQEVDEKSGEDIYTASIEEYSHIYCGECGDESDWTVCGKCVGKTPAKGKKAEKITTRHY